MSDQKKWVKVWNSILVDPDHTSMSLENVGRWTRLLAYVAMCGEKGKLTIKPPATTFLILMGVKTLKEAKSVIEVLPNVYFTPPESGKLDDNDTFSLSFKNWHKYQVDSTIYERIKRLRRKKREDKIRKEESENGVSTSTSKPLAGPYGG